MAYPDAAWLGVLTGDIIGFSDMPTEVRRGAADRLRAAAADVRLLLPPGADVRIDVFRGDSWQLVTDAPAGVLHAALAMRAALVAGGSPRMDTRIGIAAGYADFVPDDHAATGDGPVFRRSGGSLEELSRRRRLQFACPDPALTAALNVALYLADAILEGWTPLQARAVRGALRGLSREEIRGLWEPPISVQAVGEHLRKAGWEPLSRLLDYSEEMLNGLINENKPI